MAVPCVVGLAGSMSYAANTLRLIVRARPPKAIEQNMQLAVYLIEDSIVSWQRDYSRTPNDLPNYMHKHMLRGQLAMVPAFLQAGTINDKQQTFTITRTLNNPLSHYRAFAVLKGNGDEVMQVADIPLTGQ